MARPLSLSVEGVRAKLLERVAIPPELITKALRVTEKALEAKRTKYFTQNGKVVDQRETVDNTTRLAAADQLYSLAGMYAREQDSPSAMNNVAVEIDSKTGVIRLVVGERPTTNVIVADSSHTDIHALNAGEEQLPLVLDANIPDTMKPRGKYKLPESQWKVLLDEEDPG